VPRKTIVFRGMNEDDVWSADPAFAERIEDMERTPEGVWRSVPGLLGIEGDFPSVLDWGDDFTVDSMSALVWFEPAANQRFLVYEGIDADDASVARLCWVWRWESTGDPGGHQLIATRRRAASRAAPSTFLQIRGWLYHLNGLEHPIRWDGRVTHPVGWTGPAPAPRVAGTSEGFEHFDAAGWDGTGDFAHDEQRGVGTTPASGTNRWLYACAVTVENDLGQESPMSPIAWAHGENSALNGRAGIRWWVPRMPTQARRVTLWRSVNLQGVTEADNPTMYKLATFPFAGQFDYLDLHPDQELGIAHDPDATGAVPLGVRVAEFWKERLWLAVKDRLHFSAPLFHEVFPFGNQITIGSSSSGDITAIKAIPAGLCVFKTRGVYLVKWDGLNSPVVETIDESEGTVAPRAVEYIPGIGLVFLASSGPKVLRGILEADATTAIVPLKGIRKTWGRLVAGNAIETAWVVHRPEAEEVWFHVPLLGEVFPTTGFVYHYGDGGTWSLRPRWYVNAVARYRGTVWMAPDGERGGIGPSLCYLTRGSTTAYQAIPGTLEMAAPSDPSVPYTRTAATIGGVFVYSKTSVGDDGYVKPLYVTGVVRSTERFVVQSVELRNVLTGDPTAIEVQVRQGQSPTFEKTSETHHLYDRFAEDNTREFWSDVQATSVPGGGSWSTTKFWHDHEPGVVVRDVQGRVVHAFQVALGGTQPRLHGLDLVIAPANGPKMIEPEPNR
jgi:hypothetical protein